MHFVNIIDLSKNIVPCDNYFCLLVLGSLSVDEERELWSLDYKFYFQINISGLLVSFILPSCLYSNDVHDCIVCNFVVFYAVGDRKERMQSFY